MSEFRERGVVDLVIVDDDKMSLELAQRKLRKKDIELLCFTDEIGALAYLQRHAPRVLIVDQRMSCLDGIDFLEQLAESGCVAADHIYLWSAAALPEDVSARARQIGAGSLLKDSFKDAKQFLALLVER